MTRFFKHWRSLPPLNRVITAVCAAILLVVIIVLAFQLVDLANDLHEAFAVKSPRRCGSNS